jgi:hypothetical protein
MYKPNGEERMTAQEERRRKEAIALRKIEKTRAEANVEAMCSTIYETILSSPDPREELIAASFSNLR